MYILIKNSVSQNKDELISRIFILLLLTNKIPLCYSMHDTESIMHLFYLLFLIVLSLC